MIGTRRLKNVVIYIQTILSFVPARKIRNMEFFKKILIFNQWEWQKLYYY